jgi:HK97 family phage major capsid protein
MSLREVGEALAAKRKKVGDILDGCKVDGEYKMSAEQISEVRQLNAELKDLSEQHEELKGIEEIRRGWEAEDDDEEEGRKAGAAPDRPERRRAQKGKAQRPDSIKGLLRESPGTGLPGGARQDVRVRADRGGVEDAPHPRRHHPAGAAAARHRALAQAFQDVEDLFAHGTINSNAYEYYEETTFTNAAAETAEGSAKPEAALDFTLRTDNMRKIPVWLPATSEVLEDNDALESYIRERLRFMVIQRRAGQLLNGDGTAPNISGITDRSGIQTQAKGTDPVFDALLKAMTKVRVTGDAEPSGIVMHPNDWQDLVLTRTADGIYILGNPSDPEVGQRIWGKMVRVTPSRPRTPRSSARSTSWRRSSASPTARSRSPSRPSTAPTSWRTRSRSWPRSACCSRSTARPRSAPSRASVGAINLIGSADIPSGAVVLGGLIDVITALTSGGAATGALKVEGAGDLVAATVVSGAPWSTTGRKSIIPVFTGATTVKTTAARDITLTVAVAALTAGKFDVYLVYLDID